MLVILTNNYVMLGSSISDELCVIIVATDDTDVRISFREVVGDRA